MRHALRYPPRYPAGYTATPRWRSPSTVGQRCVANRWRAQRFGDEQGPFPSVLRDNAAQVSPRYTDRPSSGSTYSSAHLLGRRSERHHDDRRRRGDTHSHEPTSRGGSRRRGRRATRAGQPSRPRARGARFGPRGRGQANRQRGGSVTEQERRRHRLARACRELVRESQSGRRRTCHWNGRRLACARCRRSPAAFAALDDRNRCARAATADGT